VPVIVITGASSGIGEAIALQYASSRACQCATSICNHLFIYYFIYLFFNSLVLSARLVLAARSRDKLKAVAIKCRKLGCEVAIIPTDVSKPKQCKCVHLFFSYMFLIFYIYYYYYYFNNKKINNNAAHGWFGRRFLIKESIRIFGRLDYLVLNAGVSMHIAFEELKVRAHPHNSLLSAVCVRCVCRVCVLCA
jgi:NAD(P)-dependent dehydrogenase (short-subunit alcohol dehydrogenase family)